MKFNFKFNYYFLHCIDNISYDRVSGRESHVWKLKILYIEMLLKIEIFLTSIIFRNFNVWIE